MLVGKSQNIIKKRETFHSYKNLSKHPAGWWWESYAHYIKQRKTKVKQDIKKARGQIHIKYEVNNRKAALSETMKIRRQWNDICKCMQKNIKSVNLEKY